MIMKNTFYGLMSRWTTVLSVLFVVSCATTPQQAARHVVDGAGEVLTVVDAAQAQAYTQHARVALAAASDFPTYRASMAEEDAAVEAIQIADSALRVGESIVNLWDQNGSITWPHAEICILAAMLHVRDAFAAAGYTLPPELAVFVDGIVASIDLEQCSLTPAPVAPTPGGA